MQKISLLIFLLVCIVFATTEVTHKTSIKQLEMDDLNWLYSQKISGCVALYKREDAFSMMHTILTNSEYRLAKHIPERGIHVINNGSLVLVFFSNKVECEKNKEFVKDYLTKVYNTGKF